MRMIVLSKSLTNGLGFEAKTLDAWKTVYRLGEIIVLINWSANTAEIYDSLGRRRASLKIPRDAQPEAKIYASFCHFVEYILQLQADNSL